MGSRERYLASESIVDRGDRNPGLEKLLQGLLVDTALVSPSEATAVDVEHQGRRRRRLGPIETLAGSWSP